MPLDVDLRGYPNLRVAEHTYLGDTDPEATNRLSAQERVVPRTRDPIAVSDGHLRTELPPLSWNMLRVRAE